MHQEALPDLLVLNLLVLVTAQNYLNSKCYTWFTEALQACEIVFVAVTNGYLSPFRAYRLWFLHPVPFVELNFRNYFRGFFSVRSWNAFCFYSYYLSNKGRNWVLICPLISQKCDCFTSLCSVCNEGAHRLLFLKLFFFVPKGLGQVSKCLFPCACRVLLGQVVLQEESLLPGLPSARGI